MDFTNPALLLLGPFSAATLHEFVLRRAEVDHLAVPIIVTSCIVYSILVWCKSLYPATLAFASFWVPLWLYIGIYRAFFHPLRTYPGPFKAKLSKWWTIKQVISSNRHFHRVQQQLQKQYGDYVRTGPRELTIFDVDAIPAILGVASKTSKGPFYDVLETSLHLNRDNQFHRQRRRVWDNAFKSTLSGYAPRIEEFTKQLLDRLRDHKGSPAPLLTYISYFAYDVMGELAFSQPMGFTKGESSDVANKILDTMTKSVPIMGLLQHMPWLMNALSVLTSLAGPMKDWTDYSVSQMKARIAREKTNPDFMSHLIKNTSSDQKGRALLYGDARLMISAGSETVSTAITFALIQLATHLKYTRAVRDEFRANTSTYNCEKPLPMLDAIINESMRLWPSVFFNPQRVTPPEGLSINGRFVPGNMIVQIPLFALFRDPRNFVKPDEFIPERWHDQPQLVLRKDAFFPFMTGPNSCAGKGLAWMEMRSVIGKIVDEFDVQVPKDFNDKKYWESIQDQFTAGSPPQSVRFVATKD